MKDKKFNRKIERTRDRERWKRTTGYLLKDLVKEITETRHLDPHPALVIASHHFHEPYPKIMDISLLSLATMDLLIQFAYPQIVGYAKFTITLKIIRPFNEEIQFTIGQAIPLTYEDGRLIPKRDIFSQIYQRLKIYKEIYDNDDISSIGIRVYMEEKKQNWRPLSLEERERSLYDINIDDFCDEPPTGDPIRAREIQHRKVKYPSHITALKQFSTKRKPFIVADTETILINNVHTPYAAGLLMVRPGEEINDIMIDTYFSEDYSIILDSFEERSTKVLYDLVLRISTIVRKEK